MIFSFLPTIVQSLIEIMSSRGKVRYKSCLICMADLVCRLKDYLEILSLPHCFNNMSLYHIFFIHIKRFAEEKVKLGYASCHY